MKPSSSAERLSEMINKAINDGELTTAEYDKILAIANEDMVIDSQEKQLLTQLQDMLANRTVKKVK